MDDYKYYKYDQRNIDKIAAEADRIEKKDYSVD